MRRTGYQSSFINGFDISLPKLNSTQKKDLVTVDRKKTGELKYLHFSLFLSKSRRFPFFTATNIDGSQFVKIPRKQVFDSGRDEWSLDERAIDFQWGQNLYNAKKSDFQRGHMTKREDPQWGDDIDEAREAAQQTFTFTNCVPQLGDLNTEDWGKLETYILSKQSVPNSLRIAVFTGPVLNDTDPVFVTAVNDQEVQIPVLFWKIVYYSNDGDKLNRVGFLMGQEDLLLERGIAVQRVSTMAVREVVPEFFQDFEDKDIYQVNIDTIEKLSNLKFMRAAEPFKDKRPLKLILKKVQVTELQGNEMVLSNVEGFEENEILESNMVLDGSGAEPMKREISLLDTEEIYTGTVSTMAAGHPRMGPAQLYTSELKDYFGYHATWDPGIPLKIGDIGVMKDGIFRKTGMLESHGFEFKIRHDTEPSDINYSTKGSVSIGIKLAGAASLPGSSLAQADAGISVEFLKENSILFQAKGTLTHQVEETYHLGKKIIEFYKNGKWNKDWLVITDLVVAESATILIAKERGTKFELKANAKIDAPSIDIADASFAFTSTSNHKMETQIIASKGITPLFRLMGIKANLFVKPIFQPMGILPGDLLTPEIAKTLEQEGKIWFDYL